MGSLCALGCSPLHGIMGRVGRSQLLFAVDEKGMGELVVKCLCQAWKANMLFLPVLRFHMFSQQCVWCCCSSKVQGPGLSMQISKMAVYNCKQLLQLCAQMSYLLRQLASHSQRLDLHTHSQSCTFINIRHAIAHVLGEKSGPPCLSVEALLLNKLLQGVQRPCFSIHSQGSSSCSLAIKPALRTAGN